MRFPNKAHMTAWLISDDIDHWKVVLPGPPNSAYEGGLFQCDLSIPDSYPFNPIKVRFDTKVWHPNINDKTGIVYPPLIAMDWHPAVTVKR